MDRGNVLVAAFGVFSVAAFALGVGCLRRGRTWHALAGLTAPLLAVPFAWIGVTWCWDGSSWWCAESEVVGVPMAPVTWVWAVASLVLVVIAAAGLWRPDARDGSRSKAPVRIG